MNIRPILTKIKTVNKSHYSTETHNKKVICDINGNLQPDNIKLRHEINSDELTYIITTLEAEHKVSKNVGNNQLE